MTPIHVLPVPAAAHPLPALLRRERPSLTSGLVLGLLLLALLLQASFFVGLARGRVAGPVPGPARAADVR